MQDIRMGLHICLDSFLQFHSFAIGLEIKHFRVYLFNIQSKCGTRSVLVLGRVTVGRIKKWLNHLSDKKKLILSAVYKKLRLLVPQICGICLTIVSLEWHSLTAVTIFMHKNNFLMCCRAILRLVFPFYLSENFGALWWWNLAEV